MLGNTHGSFFSVGKYILTRNIEDKFTQFECPFGNINIDSPETEESPGSSNFRWELLQVSLYFSSTFSHCLLLYTCVIVSLCRISVNICV